MEFCNWGNYVEVHLRQDAPPCAKADTMLEIATLVGPNSSIYKFALNR